MMFVCYPNCSTCKKALRFLEGNDIAVSTRDIKLQNPNAAELKLWHQKSGLPLARFFNTSGQKYRELGLKDKLPTMSEAAQYDLLATDGMLVKRPILVADDFVMVGFREDAWREKILK